MLASMQRYQKVVSEVIVISTLNNEAFTKNNGPLIILCLTERNLISVSIFNSYTRPTIGVVTQVEHF